MCVCRPVRASAQPRMNSGKTNQTSMLTLVRGHFLGQPGAEADIRLPLVFCGVNCAEFWCRPSTNHLLDLILSSSVCRLWSANVPSLRELVCLCIITWVVMNVFCAVESCRTLQWMRSRRWLQQRWQTASQQHILLSVAALRLLMMLWMIVACWAWLLVRILLKLRSQNLWMQTVVRIAAVEVRSWWIYGCFC